MSGRLPYLGVSQTGRIPNMLARPMNRGAPVKFARSRSTKAARVTLSIASVSSNTLIDARQVTTGRSGVSVQQMTVALAADLALVADKFNATKGVQFVSRDGFSHRIRTLIPGLSVCASRHSVTLQSGTTADPYTLIDIRSLRRVTVNGTLAPTGSVNAGRFARSGAVTISHE